jgi:hypothetical protein
VAAVVEGLLDVCWIKPKQINMSICFKIIYEWKWVWYSAWLVWKEEIKDA